MPGLNILKLLIKEVIREPWYSLAVWIFSLERNVIIIKRILFLKRRAKAKPRGEKGADKVENQPDG